MGLLVICFWSLATGLFRPTYPNRFTEYQLPKRSMQNKALPGQKVELLCCTLPCNRPIPIDLSCLRQNQWKLLSVLCNGHRQTRVCCVNQVRKTSAKWFEIILLDKYSKRMGAKENGSRSLSMLPWHKTQQSGNDCKDQVCHIFSWLHRFISVNSMLT